jgi:hypothetical protein
LPGKVVVDLFTVVDVGPVVPGPGVVCWGAVVEPGSLVDVSGCCWVVVGWSVVVGCLFVVVGRGVVVGAFVV